MANKEEPKVNPETGTPEPTQSAKESIAKDYREATPAARKKNFVVDPVTKTLRRA